MSFYYICQGKNEDWYDKINGNFKGEVKLVYLDPPYNTKRNRGARKSYNDKSKDWENTIKDIFCFNDVVSIPLPLNLSQ